MKKYRLLKLAGLVVLTMAVLVLISFIEVAVYSYMVNPGQDQSVYDAHANISAPWVSAIFGFIIFFLVVRYWGVKKYDNLLNLAVLFFLAYIAIDMIILLSFVVDWSEYYLIVLVANGAKLLGAMVGYYFYKGEER